MTSKIVRVGNTLAVELPEEWLVTAGLTDGESVEWVTTRSGGLALILPSELEQDLIDSSGFLDEVPEAEDDAAVLANIQAGLADFEAGRTVSHERVAAWLDSWGTENELPVPECD